MHTEKLHGIDIMAPGGINKLLEFHRQTFGDAVMENTSGDSTAEAGEETGQGGFEPITSQEEFDKRLASRLDRERKKFADYDDYKKRAQEADELQTKLADAESKNGELAEKVQGFEAEKEHSKLITSIAKEKEVPADALRGNSREELEAHAETLKALMKPTGPTIPGQEQIPETVPESEDRKAVRSLFGSD